MLRVKARGTDLGAVEIVILAVVIQPVFRDQGGSCHLPPPGHGAEQLQERDRPGGRRFHVAGESGDQPVGRLGQRGNAFGQRPPNHRKARMADLPQISIERPHLIEQQLDGCSLFIRDFAAYQIVGLDSRSALVDRRDSRIAQILRGTRFLDETHAAVDLHTRRRNFDGLLRAPAQLEKEIPELQNEKSVLEEKMNSGNIAYNELQKAAERISTIVQLLDEKEMRWLELSERL